MKWLKRKVVRHKGRKPYNTSGDGFKNRVEKQTDWAKRLNIVRLRDVEKMTFQDIADFYGCTRVNIWQLYQSAKRTIK